MLWYTIKNVPLLRAPQFSPLVAAVAAAGDTALLYWHKMGQAIGCQLGFVSGRTAEAARLQLTAAGYTLVSEEKAPVFGRPAALLERAVEPRILCGAAGPQRAMLPAAVGQACPGALFRLLAVSDKDGILLALRPSSGLDTKTTALFSSAVQQDPVAQQLLTQPRLMELVGCVFGSQLAADAACAAFPGLQAVSVPFEGSFTRPQQLFQGTGAALPAAAKALCRTFTPAEAALLCDITAEAGSCGLAINKDTIPGESLPDFSCQPRGLLLGRSAAGDRITLSPDALTKGLMLCGSPGSGKGNELFSLAMQLGSLHTPLLLIEGAKEELHHLGKALPGLRCWRPVDGEYIFNPFALPPGMTVAQYRPSMLQMMRAAFRLDGPLEELFGAALENCLARHGYCDDSTADSPGVTPFGLQEFIESYNDLLRGRGYSGKTGADMRTAGAVRLGSLFNQSRAVFDSCNTIPVSELVQGQNLIQLAPLATIQAKQLFATLLLVSLGVWMRASFPHTGGELKLVILLDEAHNLLCNAVRTTGESYSFPADFAALMLELRSVGVGFVVADQAAGNLPPVIADVCANKMFMGASPVSGVADYAREMALDDAALEHLYLLRPGEGLFRSSAASMKQSVFFRTDNIIDLFHLERPCPRKNEYLARHPRLLIETFRECAGCPGKGQCSLADKARGRSLGQRLEAQWQGEFARCLALPQGNEEQRTARSRQLGRLLAAMLVQSRRQDTGWGWYCGLVQFARAFNREADQKLRVETILENAKKLEGGMKHGGDGSDHG